MSNNKQIVSEKIQRLNSAINLTKIDQVPIVGLANFWPVNYAKKCTMQEAFYDIDAAAESYTEMFSSLNQWDGFAANMSTFGPILDATGSKRWNIPGKDISPNAEIQHRDVRLMEAEEYEELTKDPIKFIVEKVIPRLCSEIASSNATRQAKAWSKASLYLSQFQTKTQQYYKHWADQFAIPSPFQGGAVFSPLDLIADQFRGFAEGLIDVKSRPDEVSAACEALVPFTVKACMPAAPAAGELPMVFNPQHVSAFISPKDYNEVYWPSFKKVFIDHFIRQGYKVWVFLEGNQKQHLEKLQELPKGKVVAHIESTDLAEVKDMLGGKVCIAGGMPGRLLARGNPESIKKKTKEVLDLFQDEPGFIMACDMVIPGNAKSENVHAWLDAVKEYGSRGTELDATPKESIESINDDNLLPGAITSWEEVKNEFGEITGDETIIKDKWELLETAFTRVAYSLCR